MNLNERISKIIEHSRLTSSEFADEIDVQRSSISHITSGRNKPSLDFLIKVKDKFPHIRWEWLILGEGEMLDGTTTNLASSETSNSDETSKDQNSDAHTDQVENRKPSSLPDLFAFIGDTKLESVEGNEIPNFNDLRESNTADEEQGNDKIGDSQRLDLEDLKNEYQNIDKQQDKVKRIVIFYESGKFESFNP